jgi:chemotaxis protein MotB
MKRNLSILVSISFLFVLGGCVTKKQYQELELIKNHYRDEAEQLETAEEENRQLREELRTSENQLRQSIRQNEELIIQTEALERDNQDLTQRFEQLLEQNKVLLSTASYEKQSLMEQLAGKQTELETQRRELAALKLALDQRESNLDQLRSGLSQREQRIDELEQMLSMQQSQMSQIRSSLNDALLGFTQADLSIEEKEGKLYVSLSQELLFKSGSDKIDFKGKNAIKQVALALAQNPDIDVTVLGHTDSDGSAATNWDLSVSRATTVVKVLTEFGVSPERITASGRGLYDPVAPNDTSYNKALNRRTEIILSPKLDALYQMIRE